MKIQTQSTLTDRIPVRDIITLLLKQRGIDDQKKDSFFSPPNPNEMTLKDVGLSETEFKKAFKRLESAYARKESIVVYTDYDVDGITGGTIMWETLHELGFNVMPYIPDRRAEGYGFSEKGVENIMREYNPTLVISVDHGISGEKFINLLKQKNVDVIVCDHHVKLLGDPESAHAIMYSKLICGAGVSYFFAKEIFSKWLETHEVTEKHKNLLLDNFSHDYIVLAGIGTISDIMPLQGPSRSLALFGLLYLKTVKSMGLRELLKNTGLASKDSFSSYDVGFVIGPRINAAGRMGDALDALRLLCTRKVEKAQSLVSVLNSHNSKRQTKVEEYLTLAHELLGENTKDPILFVHSPEFEEGTVGLVASKLMDEFYRPVFVATESNGHLKGSARSIKGVDITDIFKESSVCLESFGGHERAGGFLLEKKNVAAFKKALQSYGEKHIAENLLERIVAVDLATPLSNVTLGLARELNKFEPFGVANEQPVFSADNVFLTQVRTVGKTGTHVQCYVKDEHIALPLKAVFFGGAKKMDILLSNKPVTVIFSITIDTWKGEQVAIHIKDVFSVA